MLAVAYRTCWQRPHLRLAGAPHPGRSHTCAAVLWCRSPPAGAAGLAPRPPCPPRPWPCAPCPPAALLGRLRTDSQPASSAARPPFKPANAPANKGEVCPAGSAPSSSLSEPEGVAGCLGAAELADGATAPPPDAADGAAPAAAAARCRSRRRARRAAAALLPGPSLPVRPLPSHTASACQSQVRPATMAPSTEEKARCTVDAMWRLDHAVKRGAERRVRCWRGT